MRIRPVTLIEHEAYKATAAAAGITSPSLELYLTSPSATAYVAEEEGEVVGTGAAVRYEGGTGWLAAISVRPDRQGRGLGRALAEWGEQDLREHGVRSIILAASERGRPLYEKMGYAVGLFYHSFPGSGGGAIPEGIRPMTPGDWPALLALDQTATGERRTWALQAMPSGFVADGPGGELRGFYLPAPWGGGPAMATDPQAGRLLLDLARASAGPNPLVLRLPEVNQPAITYLESIGFAPRSRTTYMVKGPRPASYRPEWIWGMFSFGLG